MVIAIIGTLIAMLLPAIQSARETARRTQCGNNVKQLALGCLQHERAAGRFPTGGWGYRWIGDPDRGNDWRQPGGWIFNVLPYIEQQRLHELQFGKNGQARLDAASQMLATPLSLLNCPSRRPPVTYPCSSSFTDAIRPRFANHTYQVARTDYACNGGDRYADAYSVRAGGSITGFNPGGPDTISQGEDPRRWALIAVADTGIIYPASQVTAAHVLDGLSNTYLLGEKYLGSNYYATGRSGADNESMYIGDNADICRWGGPSYPVYQDVPNYDYWYGFGSVHTGGFCAAFCDGSARWIDYSISLPTHGYLSNRRDGNLIDQGGF